MRKSLNFLEESSEKPPTGGVAIQTPLPAGTYPVTCTSAMPRHLYQPWAMQKYGRQAQSAFRRHELPTKEDVEYVDSIKRDIRWLASIKLERWRRFRSFDQASRLEWASGAIRKGPGSCRRPDAGEIREGRGTVSEPGKESPWRNRSAEETRPVRTHTKARVLADGEKVLRAKIDMRIPTDAFRDPDWRTASSMPATTARAMAGCIYPDA